MSVIASVSICLAMYAEAGRVLLTLPSRVQPRCGEASCLYPPKQHVSLCSCVCMLFGMYNGQTILPDEKTASNRQKGKYAHSTFFSAARCCPTGKTQATLLLSASHPLTMDVLVILKNGQQASAPPTKSPSAQPPHQPAPFWAS